MKNLVEGETAPIDTVLYDGEGTSRAAIDGSGLDVTLMLRDRTGADVPVTGRVAWLIATDGSVRYEPVADDLKAARSPYAARFKVTDTDGKNAFYPNGEADEWIVRR